MSQQSTKLTTVHKHPRPSLERVEAAVRTLIESAGSVAFVVPAAHQWMTPHGIKKPGGATVTRGFPGCFQTTSDLRREFVAMVSPPSIESF